MGIFSKKRPIDEFNSIYMGLKIRGRNLLLTLESTFAKDMPKLTPAEHDTFYTMCNEYLLGEIHPEAGPGATAEVKKNWVKLYKTIPLSAKKLYKITLIQAYYCAVMEFKYERLSELLGDEWTESEEAKNVNKMIADTPVEIEDTEDYKNFKQSLDSFKI